MRVCRRSSRSPSALRHEGHRGSPESLKQPGRLRGGGDAQVQVNRHGCDVVVVGLLLAGPAIAGPPASNALKLGGAWVASIVGTPAQWSYTVAPDPSGRRGTGYGTINVGLYVPGLSEQADVVSPFVLDLVMSGRNTVKFNSVWYGLRKLPPGTAVTTTEVVYIGINWGELTFVAPGRAEGTHNIESTCRSRMPTATGCRIPVRPLLLLCSSTR